MSELVDHFVHEITSFSSGLRAAQQATLDYWRPCNPPAIVALSELGHRIVDDFKSVDRATSEAIFKLIEDALAKGNSELSTVVATGMIEGIVGRAIPIGIWNEVQPLLGKLSASHAAAWASSC